MDCDFKIEYSTEIEDSNESNPVLSIAMDTSEQATSDIKSEINPWIVTSRLSIQLKMKIQTNLIQS